MRKLRVLVATVGAALAIGLFPAPAQATHIQCITQPENGLWQVVHEIECYHEPALNHIVEYLVCWSTPTCFN